MRLAFANFVRSVEQEASDKKIRKIDARHLFINLISLIIFPFVGRPMIQGVFAIDNEAFKQLLAERKVHIKEFIRNAIKV